MTAYEQVRAQLIASPKTWLFRAVGQASRLSLTTNKRPCRTDLSPPAIATEQ